MSALNATAKRRLIPFNPAAFVELASGRRRKAVLWTDERIEEWRRTGTRPKVAVWTPEQTGAFLDHASTDRLYALYHLVTFRGLRRGEAAGLPWAEVDLAGRSLSVTQQIVQLGYRTESAPPKGDSSRRVALDEDCVTALRAHKARQDSERLAWGTAWVDTGLVFTREDGSPLHPEFVTRHFERLAREAGLPPIRLHLRHGAATLALAGGADLKRCRRCSGTPPSPSPRTPTPACCPRWPTGPPRPPPASFRACSRQNPRGPVPSRSHLPPKTTSALRPRGRKARSWVCAARDLNPQPAD